MTRYHRFPGLMVGFVFLVGCAGVPTQPTTQKPPLEKLEIVTDLSLAEKFRNKAAAHEKGGEIRKAILLYEATSALDPSDSQIIARIGSLKKKSRSLSEKHFAAGMAHFSNSEYLEARKAFLLALYFDPEKTEALDFLKVKIPGETYTEYTVREGDTLEQIASQTYYDPGKDFVIAYYNDLGKKASLSPGTVLKLPIIDFLDLSRWVDTEGYFTGISMAEESIAEPGQGKSAPKEEEEKKPLLAALPPSLPVKPPPAEVAEIDRELVYAEKLFKFRRYLEAIPASEKILAQVPGNRRARDILNESAYQAGKMMLASKSYDKAIMMFNKVEPQFKDVAASQALAEKNMADFHYLAGVRFFINEEVEKAIREWETTLSLDPRHTKAARDLENARMVLKRLKEIQ